MSPAPKKLDMNLDTSPKVSIRNRPDLGDPSKWLTRDEAIIMLGCARQTLYNYERRGVLNPQNVYRPDTVKGGGKYLAAYHQDELRRVSQKLPKRPVLRDPRDTSAFAFEAFRKGENLTDIVISLRVTPAEIKRLYAEWLDLQNNTNLQFSPYSKELFEKVVGPFKSIAELLKLIEARFSTSTV